MALPGDDRDPRPYVTRAITIYAPPEVEWPWIVQMARTEAASTAIRGWRTGSALTSTTRRAFTRSGSSERLAIACRCGGMPTDSWTLVSARHRSRSPPPALLRRADIPGG